MEIETESPKLAWERDGYVILRALFSPVEVEGFREHFMAWNSSERQENFDGMDPASGDPLALFPRIIHPHRRDAKSLDFLLDPRLREALLSFLPEEPYGAQTMFYFKPPGGRGQALHQDQTYLRAAPGTCVAAWLAVDDCTLENGCMSIVPGSHKLPLLCPGEADMKESFTGHQVPVPDGMQVVPALMKAGDVLFFHGNLIHGSGANRSTDQFRRSLIAHYITADSTEAWKFYHPLLRFDGSEANLSDAEMGSECGVFQDGELRLIPAALAGPGEAH